jgi:altronate hydrolase
MDIAYANGMQTSAQMHHAHDPIASGTTLTEVGAIVTCEDIPGAHKVALRSLRAGDPVRRYGQIIVAMKSLCPG